MSAPALIRRCVVISISVWVLSSLTACTDYEREGFNPKPFNAPASWEMNPYDAPDFRN